MVLLDSITITSFQWTLLAFFIVQVIAFGKFILALYSKVNAINASLKANTSQDEKDNKGLDTLEQRVIDNDKAQVDRLLAEKKSLYKRLKEVEDKSDKGDKEAMKRIDGVGQGLTGVERDFKHLDKRLEKLE